jgi:Fic family protein
VILREKDKSRKDNGVWLATTTEHHASLAKEFPSMRSISLFESRGPTGWQNLPAESDDFEESVTRVCQLIKKNDPRLGKIPKPKKSSGKKSRK